MYYGNGALTFIAAGIGNVFNFYEGESKLVSGFNVVWFLFFFFFFMVIFIGTIATLKSLLYW